MRVQPAALALLCTLGIAGCGAPETGTLALSWQFADGRRCTDAGAATVEARGESRTIGTFPCDAGELPQAVMLASVPEEATLDLIARSPAGVELYRGTLATSALAPQAVTLYATGSR